MVLLSRPGAATDARFHPHHYLSRHPHSIPPPPTLLDRSRVVPPVLGAPPLPPHFSTGPGSTWPGADPFRDNAYRFDPLQQLRFNPLMAAAFRAEEEERAKLFQPYPPPPGPHLRGKAPSPSGAIQNNHHLHHRAGPGPGPGPGPIGHKLACPTPPSTRPLDGTQVVDLHKKEESSQSR